MDKKEVSEKLRSIGQLHLLQYFDVLPPQGQKAFLEQVDSVNIPTFRMQQQMLLKHPPLSDKFLEPFKDYAMSGNVDDREAGKKLIAEGKVGCVIIAGGQATRLKVQEPKGTLPVTRIKQKSLFQLFAEKTLAAGQESGRNLPLAIMTSPLNHEATVRYFETHHNFGLNGQQLTFFTQGMLPLLDRDGNLFLERKDAIAMGPDGNGSVFKNFCSCGLWKKWREHGVRFVQYILVDNALADPFDAELAGHHQRHNGEAMVKCTERRDVLEKVGLLVKHEDKIKVVEYSEFPKAPWEAKEADGRFQHICANISLFSFTMDFIEKASTLQLPLHPAHKASKMFTAEGKEIKSSEPNCWKFEMFLFDVLPAALRAAALLYPREECFAPLKNATGTDTLATVQAALQERDRQILAKITGEKPPEAPFELSQEFYYPSEKLIREWKGKKLTEGGYITTNE